MTLKDFQKNAKDKSVNAELLANRYAVLKTNVKRKPGESIIPFTKRWNNAYEIKYAKNILYIKSVRGK